MGLRCDVKKFNDSIAQIIECLCPGALSLHLSRIDTQKKHPHKSLYESDRNQFRVTRQPSFIREAHTGEFDASPSNSVSVETYPSLNFQSVAVPKEALKSVWKHIPRLWIMVTEITAGTHHVSTIYRGNAMWPVAEIDGSDIAQFKSAEELAQALEKIQDCEGLDQASWKHFCERAWDAAVVDAAVIDMKGSVIH